MWFQRLAQPLDYLRIDHPAKAKYDYLIPALLAVALTVWVVFAPRPVSVFGQNGLLSIAGGLLQMLTGFYIASLAAIATFTRRSMDLVMPGVPPRLNVFERGVERQLRLTRRRFLCLMFGYMAFLSLFLYLLGMFVVPSITAIKEIIPVAVHGYARGIFVAMYFFLFSNLLITTLLGLYYMADRIHRHDASDVSEEEKATAEECD